MAKLVTKNFILSPKDKLPDVIDDPKELITKITKKITINSKQTNLNDVFQWTDLAEKTLKRYSNFDEKLIINLKYNLATVLYDKSDYKKARKLLKDVIKRYSEQSKPNKKKLSSYYYNMAMTLRRMGDYKNAQTNILNAMKKYADAIDYLEYPFVITDNKEKMVLLAYNGIIMEAPEIKIFKTGPSALKMLKVLERKNIPITVNAPYASAILEDCNSLYLFQPISQKNWKIAAEILVGIYKDRVIQ
jgi:tetratricopeptide (TPR) repeat protein